MDTFDEAQKRKKLTWPVIALMDFVTVIGFVMILLTTFKTKDWQLLVTGFYY